jgi:hypothetical protein
VSTLETVGQLEAAVGIAVREITDAAAPPNR